MSGHIFLDFVSGLACLWASHVMLPQTVISDFSDGLLTIHLTLAFRKQRLQVVYLEQTNIRQVQASILGRIKYTLAAQRFRYEIFCCEFTRSMQQFSQLAWSWVRYWPELGHQESICGIWETYIFTANEINIEKRLRSVYVLLTMQCKMLTVCLGEV